MFRLFTKPTLRYVVAGLLAALASAPTASIAAPICFQKPTRVPNFAGMPQWPGAGQSPTSDSDTDTPYDERTSGFVSDPRWTGSPLRQMFINDPEDTYNDRVRYRVVVDRYADAVTDPDPTQLAVSMQIRQSPSNPTANDYIYFGIADNPDSGQLNEYHAWGVRISLQSSGDRYYAPVADSDVTHFSLSGGTWNSAEGEIPGWIVPDTLAIWNLTDPDEAALNGARVAVHFKINLETPQAGSGLPDLSPLARNSARMMLGADYTIAAGKMVQFSIPNVGSCWPTCDWGGGGFGVSNPFFNNPATWAETAVIGSKCTGISISRADISATHVGAVATDCEGRSNCLSPFAGSTNTFEASPVVPPEWLTNPLPTIINDGELITSFWMSNWGTVARASEWKPLGEAVYDVPVDPVTLDPIYPDNDLDVNPMNLTCAAETSDQEVCGQTFTTTGSPGFHQCLLASLRANSQAAEEKMSFQKASAYINTRFEEASLIDTVAEINVRGLLDNDPSKPSRDVYLHVVRTNMPPAGEDAVTDDVSALEATRSQCDRDFSEKTDGCSHPTDVCLPLDGPEVSGCVSYCIGDGEECPPGRMPIQYVEETCICIPENTIEDMEWCTFEALPQDGGYNSNDTALDCGEVLTAQYPTVEVFPYYDSGRTAQVNGETIQILVPMPSFGIHAWHEGTFYGWLTDIVEESGGNVDVVIPDSLYKISVDKAEGIKRIRVLVSAETSPHYAPLTEIAGSAVVLSFRLGSVFLTGVTNTSVPIDFSKSELTLRNLLLEGTTERVTNLNGPVTLSRLPGATPFVANFVGGGSGRPTFEVTVTDLPLIGQLIQINAVGASVTKPKACPFFFGRAMLQTEFSLGDGTNEIAVRGEDQWSCAPFALWN